MAVLRNQIPGEIMDDFKFKRLGDKRTMKMNLDEHTGTVIVESGSHGAFVSQTVEAVLLYRILEALNELAKFKIGPSYKSNLND
jgi:hypothetical protein